MEIQNQEMRVLLCRSLLAIDGGLHYIRSNHKYLLVRHYLQDHWLVLSSDLRHISNLAVCCRDWIQYFLLQPINYQRLVKIEMSYFFRCRLIFLKDFYIFFRRAIGYQFFHSRFLFYQTINFLGIILLN